MPTCWCRHAGPTCFAGRPHLTSLAPSDPLEPPRQAIKDAGVTGRLALPVQFSTAGAVGEGAAPGTPYQPLTGAALAQQMGLLAGSPGGGAGGSSGAGGIPGIASAAAAAAGAASQYSVAPPGPSLSPGLGG